MKKYNLFEKINIFDQRQSYPKNIFTELFLKKWRFLAFLVNFLTDNTLQRFFGLFRFAASL